MNPPFQVVCADKALEEYKMYWGEIYTVVKVMPNGYSGREYDLLYFGHVSWGHWRKRFFDLEEMQAVNFAPVCRK